MALVEEIRSWAAPLLTGEGYELVEIEYVRENKDEQRKGKKCGYPASAQQKSGLN